MSARTAYYTNESFSGVKGGFHIAHIVEGEAGYYRGKWFPTLEEAQEECARRNDILGITRDDALDIVASSIGAPK